MNHFLIYIFKITPTPIIRYIYRFLQNFQSTRQLIIKVFSKIIPNQLEINNVIVALNKYDPVVSGSLTLGLYEKYFTEIFLNSLKVGDIVIDIGANIGYYSLLAAKKVGSEGKVFSFEPETQNFSFLKKSIELNNFMNIEPQQIALGNAIKNIKFYTSPINKGDNRIYDFPHSICQELVNMTTLDQFVFNYGIKKIDLIKIDIQGGEPFALEGMRETLKIQNNIIIFTEFYPAGIFAAGSDPMIYLIELSQLGFVINEIDEKKGLITPIVDFHKFILKIHGGNYLNLICIKKIE